MDQQSFLPLWSDDQPETTDRQEEGPIQRVGQRIHRLMDEGHHLALGFSSGKDSSALAAIVLATAAERIANKQPVEPIVVVHNDTGVESPAIRQLARTEMQKMKQFAARHGFKLEIHISTPTLSASWAVRIIGGRAMPSFPDGRGDCSIDWKVNPSTAKLRQLDQALKAQGKPGHVVLTGVRQNESATRDLKIKARNEQAQGIWLNPEGAMRSSPLLDATVDDVWEIIGMANAGMLDTYSTFEGVMDIYRAAGGDSCVIVADMRIEQGRQAKPCGARTGCWACVKIRNDTSLEQMIDSDPAKYGYIRPLNRLRNFISRTQYDWSRRQFVGRTIDKDGYIKVGADGYSPGMLMELLRYTLAAQKASGCHVLGLEHIIAIDARWAMYGLHRPFSALQTYLQWLNGEEFSQAPSVQAFPKTDVPVLGKIKVGQPWAQMDHGYLGSGLSDPLVSMHQESCAFPQKRLSSGHTIIDHEDEAAMEVDLEGAAMFLDFEAEDMIRTHCRHDHPDWTVAYRTYLRYGLLTISKGKSHIHDEIVRRTQWRQQQGLHGTQTTEALRERCHITYAQQGDLLCA